MDLRVAVEAGVGEDHQAVVEVGGLAQGRQDHAAGRDPGQDQRVDLPCPQEHVEVAAREAAHPTLGHHDVAGRGRDLGVDFQARVAGAE